MIARDDVLFSAFDRTVADEGTCLEDVEHAFYGVF